MEVKQNVNAANLLQVGNQTGKTQSKANTDKATDDFTSYLVNAQNNTVSDMSVSKKMDVSKQPESSKQVDSVKDLKYQQKESSVEDKSNGVDEKKSEIAEKTAADKKESVQTDVSQAEESDGKNMDIDSEVDIMEVEMSDILELVANLLQNVMDQFQLTTEELSGKLEEFGMEMTDLLSEDGLKDFFLNMNSAERSDLLVNEDLNVELDAFLEEFRESLQTLDTMDASMDSVLSDENIESVITHGFSPSQVEKQPLEKQSTGNQQLSEDVIDEPEVIVEKQTEKSDTKEQSAMNQQTKDSETQLETSYSRRETISSDERNNTFENPILQAINNAVNQVEEVVTNNQTVKGTDVIRQIVEQVKIQMNQDTTSLEMQLYPEHLGKIQINVVSKDGVMTARIVAENEAAKQAIENGLTNLKEAMEQQELKVEAIEVMVSTAGFEQNSEKNDSTTENQAAKGRRKIDLSDAEEEQTQEDAVEEVKMKAIGSSVSFTA